ncbi:PqiC family protein [Gluconobacter wancherniae]|uniref:PqiC family protein n=1 Tax=Gluconobacter wancherniae TaxID=1307955 RepID=UPI001B8C7C50|nr:PqiC family protein [Gluconobacter wancherniae]MBS1089401.1 membrane integrity-associated transporter subunit PqiC [Gluconobacter wancherniae]
MSYRSNYMLRSLCALGLIGSVAGCSSDPTLYTVAAVAGDALAGGPAVVEIRTPVVSPRLDRDTIVEADRGYHLKMASGDSWSEPLGDMIGHVLSRDLSQRLPATTVFAQNDAVTTTPQAFVELTINRFEADPSGYAVVSGALSVHPAGSMVSPVMTYPIEWKSKDVTTGNTDRLVAQLSAGVAAISEQAAQHLRTLPLPHITQ